MSREKKSYVDDITKLRRILDNSSDPSLKYLIAQDEATLESVRRRLSGESFKTYPKTQRFFPPSESMEPRVTIYAKIPISPRMVLPPPQIEPSIPLPEFKLVSPSATESSAPPPQISFLNEELFEVEKIDQQIPEFLEVVPKEINQHNQETSQMILDESSSVHESGLPEWQPVEEEPVGESPKILEEHTYDDVPEFERVDITEPSDEKPSENWQVPSKTEEQFVSVVEGIPVETTTTLSEPLTKKQLRAAKKAQKKKEKEEKRQKKLELKRLKKEQEPAAPQTTPEQPTFSPSQETIPVQEKAIEETEPSQINVDFNNFKGINSIDEKTAELLYKNGYFSIENLKDATVEALVQIRGIRRKLAKQIKKEIEQQASETGVSEFIRAKEHPSKKKERKKLRDSSEWETLPAKERTKKPLSTKICSYKGYTLYIKETRKRDGKQLPSYFFSKTIPERAQAAPLPEGYHIVLNKKTKVPYLKKK